MEKTPVDEIINGRSPGAPPAREPFSLLDSATGKIRAVREMTDEELKRHITTVQRNAVEINDNLKRVQNTAMTCAQMLGILQYELHRRSVALTITNNLRA